MSPKQFIEKKHQGYIAGDYTPEQVYDFMIAYAQLKCFEQRYMCQIEIDKDSICDQNGKFYVSCDDVLNADEPVFDTLSGFEVDNLIQEYKKHFLNKTK